MIIHINIMEIIFFYYIKIGKHMCPLLTIF
jgi:hypothetical protein